MDKGTRHLNSGVYKMCKKDTECRRLYWTWLMMRRRCYSKICKYYEYYGGKGIKVSKEWDDFRVFLKDMGPRPKGYSLDRIDFDGDYSKSNCRWASDLTQGQNKSNVKNQGNYGVTFHKVSGKWQATLLKGMGAKKKKHLGLFKTIEDASSAVRKARKQQPQNSSEGI